MNEHDSELIESLLREKGYEKTNAVEHADIILLNTCSIREAAAHKVYSRLGEFEDLKKNNPDLIVGVVGCLAESNYDTLVEKERNVDLIIGPRQIKMLSTLIDKAVNSKKTVVARGIDESVDFAVNHNYRQSNFQAFVTIMEGCSQACSFCIVPSVRGRAICRDCNDVFDEVKELADKGYVEITLLGQNVDFYIDKKNKIDFANLLKKVSSVDNIKRIRFMSPHPQYMKHDVIDVIRDSVNICEHFHLPVQSGSDKILKAMRRGYDIKKYRELIDYVRKKIQFASITTDFIVGFPGETEEDFHETLSFVKEIEFDSAFTFKYSKRKGTDAYKLNDHISTEEKEKRLALLNDIQDKISYKKNQRYTGKVYEVLTEGVSSKDSSIVNGRTRTNKIVSFAGEKELIGNFVNVKITEARTWTLEGAISH